MDVPAPSPDGGATPPRQLVVVGASAGGIEALSALVGSLPPDFPAPLVVAQHLDPARPSHLGDILARRGPLPVVTVDRTEKLAAGTIYVVPANRHVEITDHEVSVHADESIRPAPSVDLLLSSAAQIFGERLIAVILTGAGSDGAAGAHVVKEHGGTVVIQDPASAAYPSMPRSLAPPLVDVVAALDQIGPILVSLLDGEELESPDDLAALLEGLRERRGVDFSAYKPPTIQRRLRRRMAAAGIASLPAYLDVVAADPDEEERLVADLLIKVTRFFRDTPLFDELRATVLPELVATATRERRELRIWSAGCATGEEAYSLALIVADLVAEQGAPLGIRIFATDLDHNAIAFARRGIYPATALSELPPELVARHFTAHEDGYEVNRQIRGLIVFGNHDLGQRPPFPHMDLVLCRNVLIYFTQELQNRAMEIFAYALRDGGYLALGKSETLGPASRLFTPVARRLRIYRREGPRAVLPAGRMPTSAEFRLPPRPSALSPTGMSQGDERSGAAQLSGSRAEDLLRRLPVGIVVVDRRYDIESINGAARELLGIHGIAVGQDLIHLAQRVPSTALRTAIDAVGRREQSRSMDTVVVSETATGDTRYLSVSCHPDRLSPAGEVETIVVIVSDVTADSRAQRDGDDATAQLTAQVEGLEQTRGHLSESNRQLLGANRELTDAVDQLREQSDELRLATMAAQVSAEEIETLNEELQSSNEELETLHEEAQATVEELNVANEELQARAAELEEMAAVHIAEEARLSAILSCMRDALVVVDPGGDAVLMNDAYRDLVAVLASPFTPADERGAALPADATPQRRAARGESFQMDFTALAADGGRRWFDAVGQPLDDQNVGVLVIREITDRTFRLLQEEFLSWAGHELRTPLAALQSFLQLAMRRVGPDSDERLRHYLDLALTQIGRQTTLIEELVDASRLRSGRLTLRLTRIDLGELVRRVAEIAQALTTGQTIVVDAPEHPVEILADAGRLEQVILNLLTNAITYARGTDRIDLILRQGEDGAEVTVRDYGPGIPPTAVVAIFERFGRGEMAGQPSPTGLGLGLFIAREIVHEHGGTIDVASTVGEGAAFTVRLPAAAPEPASVAAPAPAPA